MDPSRSEGLSHQSPLSDVLEDQMVFSWALAAREYHMIKSGYLRSQDRSWFTTRGQSALQVLPHWALAGSPAAEKRRARGCGWDARALRVSGGLSGLDGGGRDADRAHRRADSRSGGCAKCKVPYRSPPPLPACRPSSGATPRRDPTLR